MAEEEEGQGEEEQTDEPGTSEEEAKKNPHGLTPQQQAAFNRQMAREKRDGKTAGRAELMRELGIEDPDELRSMINESKERREKETEEVDKLKQENERLAGRVKTLEQAGLQRDFNDKVRSSLVDAGVPARTAGKVSAMLSDLKATADDDEIADAVTDLKKEFPNLFTEQDVRPPEEEEIDPRTGLPRTAASSGPPPSDPGRQPRKATPQGDPQKQATDLLHSRHPHLTRN